jgi:hypothetical protein
VAERIRNPPPAPPRSPTPPRPTPRRSDTLWLAPGSPLAAPIVRSEPTESAQRTSPWVAGAAAVATAATATIGQVDGAPARRRRAPDLTAAALILSSAAVSAVLTALVLLQVLR